MTDGEVRSTCGRWFEWRTALVIAGGQLFGAAMLFVSSHQLHGEMLKSSLTTFAVAALFAFLSRLNIDH